MTWINLLGILLALLGRYLPNAYITSRYHFLFAAREYECDDEGGGRRLEELLLLEMEE